MQVKGKQTTDDGMEANFQIYYLANFLLVLLLMIVMREDCRVMFFTSGFISDAGSVQGPKVPNFEELRKKLSDLVVENGKGSLDEDKMRYGMSKRLKRVGQITGGSALFGLGLLCMPFKLLQTQDGGNHRYEYVHETANGWSGDGRTENERNQITHMGYLNYENIDFPPRAILTVN